MSLTRMGERISCPLAILDLITQYNFFFDKYSKWQQKAQQDAVIRQNFGRTLHFILKDLTEFKQIEDKYKDVLRTLNYANIMPYLTEIKYMYEDVDKTFTHTFLNQYTSIYNRNGSVNTNLHDQ